MQKENRGFCFVASLLSHIDKQCRTSRFSLRPTRGHVRRPLSEYATHLPSDIDAAAANCNAPPVKPRTDSTQKVFMTRTDILKCVHEPFGDAYYFGPERLAKRYEDDEKARAESGFADSTFQTIFDRINEDNTEVRLHSFVVSICFAILRS